VPGDRLAKAVVLTREGGFVVAVVPANAQVRLDTIERMLHCPVSIASEEEIGELFPDCDKGAVPPLPEAYAVEAFIDDSLEQQPDVYLEGGDHRSLIHMSGEQFRSLMRACGTRHRDAQLTRPEPPVRPAVLSRCAMMRGYTSLAAFLPKMQSMCP
jgi:Ala-tRNA(Pro) deacylase